MFYPLLSKSPKIPQMLKQWSCGLEPIHYSLGREREAACNFCKNFWKPQIYQKLSSYDFIFLNNNIHWYTLTLTKAEAGKLKIKQQTKPTYLLWLKNEYLLIPWLFQEQSVLFSRVYGSSLDYITSYRPVGAT